ncbi:MULTISPECIES: flagella biosynthesis chaperone for FliD, FliT [Shewanella]|uniref:Flagella biosynthesis chaperone for FliD, FliT n=1 Tax=Shewanella oncorhynchi TaxID=2726434 RepID=A0ABX1KKZ0_9GAMM|nr:MULTISPECIES: flagella biosynthesis chaperone for FliD, FliT [unclassified Shewanella]MBW3530997.1 flagella biosynthesis chaperone for FliD, FliT [Shewanella sp. NKUCC06_TVS]NLQ22855.1 flagella biosynthesis chaperone for FliD, FliT [Shewanella oncorhynchi]MCU8055518.1 flagella biosynthesis chaperone for FliD, FliT [Shewanella sp. SM35]MCU8064440.1 flagella biosynthesis chaperone for FliD, FliT [Shewanella sp. SM34]MCU8073602.1 flagella biosynthesis chaperone for FliD, FliT [Shewanella sp. S
MKQLDELNVLLSENLNKLTQLPAEEPQSDELVSNLQVLVGERQILLNVLVADANMTDVDYLQHQLELTQEYTSKASIVMADRQALLHAGNKNKRQISVYETIDLNR